jgi:hypothetical protein
VKAPRDIKAEYKKKNQPFDEQPLFLSRQNGKKQITGKKKKNSNEDEITF